MITNIWLALHNGIVGSLVDAFEFESVQLRLKHKFWAAEALFVDSNHFSVLKSVRNGGFGNGGTNFDAKTRRNSTDLEDIFIAHIAGMDAMARALESAAQLLEESPYKQMLADRYASFDKGIGREFEEGKLTLEQLYDYGKKVGEPKQTSGKQELYEAILNMYC